MKAIEFEASIKQSAIKIPLRFRHLNNLKARVIVLYSDINKPGNYDKQKLLLAFHKAQEKGIFNNIEDSINWQKEFRDEWE